MTEEVINKKYSIDARRTEIVTYKVVASDESEAAELVMNGVEVNGPFNKEGCELHHSMAHGITDLIPDDDEDEEIVSTEEENPCTDNADLTEEEHQILFKEMGACPYCGKEE